MTARKLLGALFLASLIAPLPAQDAPEVPAADLPEAGAVIEKMIEGRMKKFVAESTLLNQAFVINPDVTVGAAAADAGATVTGFVRIEVGEGIEKKEEDFAAEVAKAAQG